MTRTREENAADLAFEEEQARLEEQRYEAREEFFKDRLRKRDEQYMQQACSFLRIDPPHDDAWYEQMDADIGYQKEHGE